MNHFHQRKHERCVTDDEIAAALAGQAIPQRWGRVLHYRGRIGVVLEDGRPITVVRYTKKAVKQKLSGPRRIDI